MTEIPMISYWMGVPLNEVPRDELEREFCKAHTEISRLNHQISEMSVTHVREIGQFVRTSMRREHPIFYWLSDLFEGIKK